MLFMQPGKQQIKNFDKDKEIPIEGTNKYLSEAYIMSALWSGCSVIKLQTIK